METAWPLFEGCLGTKELCTLAVGFRFSQVELQRLQVVHDPWVHIDVAGISELLTQQYSATQLHS